MNRAIVLTALSVACPVYGQWIATSCPVMTEAWVAGTNVPSAASAVILGAWSTLLAAVEWTRHYRERR